MFFGLLQSLPSESLGSHLCALIPQACSSRAELWRGVGELTLWGRRYSWLISHPFPFLLWPRGLAFMHARVVRTLPSATVSRPFLVAGFLIQFWDVFCRLFACLLACFLSSPRQGFSVQPWLAWNSLCRPCQSGTQEICLPPPPECWC